MDFSDITTANNLDVQSIILEIINWLINFAAVLSVIMIIVSGFQYIFSFGDEKKVGRATSSLVFAIVGMILAFIAPLVIQFILDNFLGGK